MRVARRTFSGGEIDPDLWHNSDLVPVRTGAAKVRNFVVRQQGGVERRPGTEFIARARSSAAPVRLTRWVASQTAAWCAEWGDNTLRMHAGNAPPGGAVQDIATPYPAALVPFLQFTQSSDVQWVFSGEPIRELVRSVGAGGGTTFALEQSGIADGPFLPRNEKQFTRIKSNGLGAVSDISKIVTLTATAAVFDARHVGAFFHLEEEELADVGDWLGNAAVEAGDYVRSAGSVYFCVSRGVFEVNGGKTSGQPPVHLRGEARDAPDGVVWRYLHSGFGIVQITAVSSLFMATAKVTRELPKSVRDSGTSRWSEGAWSSLRGFPVAGALYKSALWAGGTQRQPSTIWKSAIEGFDEFLPGTDDDSALSRGLFGGASDAVRWMASGRVLTIGTSGPEWTARPDASGDTVRVGNLITEQATSQGTTDIAGVSVSGRILFVSQDRRSLRGMTFDFRNDAWMEEHFSILAAHIAGRGIREIAYQRVPWPVLWCVLDDGGVGALTYLPAQNVLAWHRHDFGGAVESLAVVPRGDGLDEAVWLAVRRQVNGVGEVHIERMFPRFRPEAGDLIETARHLDAARVYSGAPRTVLTGLDHLEGRVVAALVDGNSHPPRTVTGGQVTLNFPGSNIVVGLPVQSELTTLPFDLGLQEEFQTGRAMRLTDIGIGLRASLGGEVWVGTRMEDVFRLGDTDLDSAPDLVTGIVKVAPPASEDGGQLTYRNTTPWPATVTGIFPEYEV